MTQNGIIIRANSGFYYVETDGGVVECRARGIFRKRHTPPLVGDRVSISESGAAGVIEEIMPRKNSLVRPPVANIDRLFIVISTTQPEPNFLVIDRLIAIAEKRGIEPVIVISKDDLKDGGDIIKTYKMAGLCAFAASGVTGEGIEELRGLISGHIGAFTGNSGVGKSSLLNLIDSSLSLDTAKISLKLGRGRHTTRLVELYKTCGGYIADTPGFSSIETEKIEPILKDDLQYVFREFEPFIGKCRFTGCSHTKEDGCAVLEAVKDGKIADSRHKSYCLMYAEAKEIKEWELKK